MVSIYTDCTSTKIRNWLQRNRKQNKLSNYLIIQINGIITDIQTWKSLDFLPWLSQLDCISLSVSSHDSALLFEIENFNGGWLEIILATEEVVSWTEVIKPLKGDKSIFCPRNSTFFGNTMESVNWVPIMPSSNLIWIEIKKAYQFRA